MFNLYRDNSVALSKNHKILNDILYKSYFFTIIYVFYER